MLACGITRRLQSTNNMALASYQENSKDGLQLILTEFHGADHMTQTIYCLEPTRINSQSYTIDCTTTKASHRTMSISSLNMSTKKSNDKTENCGNSLANWHRASRDAIRTSAHQTAISTIKSMHILCLY